jgi:Leucine-rich repeat (LRR) protein
MAELTLLLRRAKRNNETKLDLSGKDISFLPNDLYTLTKLEILNLSNNKIVTLDEKINELKNLKVIDLTGNSLSDLPK